MMGTMPLKASRTQAALAEIFSGLQTSMETGATNSLTTPNPVAPCATSPSDTAEAKCPTRR